MPIMEGTDFVYTVRPGDTLYAIADRWGSTVEQISKSNALYPPITDPGLIYPGWLLIIPTQRNRSGHDVFHVISPEDTLYSIADRFNASVDLLAGINPQIVNPDVIYVNQLLVVPAFVYTVEEGDTLLKIARRFGLSLGELLEANQDRPGLSPDVIYPGFRLIVPLPSSLNIAIFRPLPGTTIAQGQQLSGFARAFEGVVQVQVRDDNNQVVTRERSISTSAGAPAYGFFSVNLIFDQQPTTATGAIWVYTRSPRDGSIQDLTEVKISFE